MNNLNSTLSNADNMYKYIDSSFYTTMTLETSISTYLYFCKDLGFHAATKILVCKSMFQKISFHDRVHLITTDNISLFLNMVTLILSTSKDGHEFLTNKLQLMMKYLPLCDTSWLPIPHTTKLIQTHILNTSNQYSLMSMLPISSFKDTDLDTHSYCPLKELLQYIVFSNMKQDTLKSKTLFKSYYIVKMLSNLWQRYSPEYKNIFQVFCV